MVERALHRIPAQARDTGYTAGVIMVAMAGVCWSTIPLGIRMIESGTVWQVLFYRSLGMLPMIFILMAWRSGGRPFKLILDAGVPGVLGGVALVLAYAGGIGAIQMTSVANAAFLFATAPFIAALLSFLLLGESVRKATWIAMLVGLAAIGFMVADSFTTGNWAGDAIALMSAVGFALFTVALRWGKAGDMLPVIFLGGLFALELSGIVLLGTGQGFALPLHEIGIALMLGFVSLGLGMVLYTLGSRVVPGAELALLAMTEVVLGPILVWLVLGETAKTATLIGGAILMAALVFNALSGLRRKPPPLTF
ncbi:MAG: DMT family transporter [Anderseniella sp.]|jgi:drug/metabolite transporter, DME family|nr:DMT family transporter [Anderseniella sp.]